MHVASCRGVAIRRVYLKLGKPDLMILMASFFERRARLPCGNVAAKLPWPIRMARRQAWKTILAAMCLVGGADLLTGDVIWFGPAYLLIIGGAAWCLGWREGLAVGCAALAIGLSSNGLSLYPYSGIAAAWNLAMRVVIVLTVVALMAKIRTGYEAEWRLARTDLLTGAINRKGFFELTYNTHQAHSWTLLAYADLDGLKKLNDQQGHRAGDEGLSLFSQHVLRMIRKGDIFARLGGDEFIIHMQVRDEAAAKAVAARLHHGMNNVVGSNQLQCSLGALILAPGSREIDAEVCAADGLMYEAKSLGASLVAATAIHRQGKLCLISRHTEPTGTSSSEGPLGKGVPQPNSYPALAIRKLPQLAKTLRSRPA